MSKGSVRLATAIVLAMCSLLLVADIAAAYPDELPDYTGDLPRTDCVDCHSSTGPEILNPGSDPVLLAAVRKGPHGGYTTGTSKCQTCHELHDAPTDGLKLLPGETIKDTCESCHDGTGGTAVYGVVEARTGQAPASAHRIEVTNTIPGGDAGGGSLAGSFTGPDGTLTCSDCHSPHDAATVQPFIGDRLRSTVASDPAYGTKTNRLLRQAPSGSDTETAVYGAGWCAACHTGRASQHATDSGAMQDHPVMRDDHYTYDELPVVTGVASTDTTIGPLGQSNRGYVMPDDPGGAPLEKSALQEGYAPLCQQCHEDARNVGPPIRETNPVVVNASQEFLVTQPDGASATDNPRFQVFPHESDAESFLVRPPGPSTDPYILCLGCHSLLHDATPGSDWVTIFAPGQHDSALPGWPNAPYQVYADCTICHTTKLTFAHADQCETCHPAPYDTIGTWTGTCQEGGCHTTIHADSPEAHDPWSPSSGGGCGTCHGPPAFSVTDDRCDNCHSVFSPSDTTPPVTTSDAQASYVGAAGIEFTITEGGKVGIGTTFSRVDGGPTAVGSSIVVSTPGTHTLEFWSVDQASNVETPAKTATFTISEDTTPPVTTSNAVSTYYYYPAQITFSATDASSLGVKATYYSLDGGAAQTGTGLSVPAVSGVVTHTVEFWSEDWSGNVETTKTANFTVIGGTGTVRFNSGPLGAGDWNDWMVWRGPRDATPDYVVSQVGPYNGYDDLALPVSATQYYIVVAWGTPSEPYDESIIGYITIDSPDDFFSF